MQPCPIELLSSRVGRELGRRIDRDPQLVRVRCGIYAPRGPWTELQPWERYLARVHAASMTLRHPVFCLESAAALTGLPIFGEPRYVHVYSRSSTPARNGDVVAHSTGDVIGTRDFGWCQTTDSARTCLDLARALPPAFGLAVVDAALRQHGVDIDGLRLTKAAAASADRRGVNRAGWIAERATASAESVGESVSRAVNEWLGFERPELQVPFQVDGRSYRGDFFWRSVGVVGEFDGWGKYDGEGLATIRSEKRREDTLRSTGLRIARWDWSDAVRANPLERALLRARVPRPRPPQPAALRTLSQHPRSFPSS